MDFSDPTSLVLSFALGLIGMGIFIYGKRQRRAPQLVIGLALMIYPYFVPRPLAMGAIGVALIGLLWLGVRMGL